MPRKKRSFVRTVLDILTVVSFILTVLAYVNPNMFVIRYNIHERIINLDVTDAYAHPSASLTASASMTFTIQNASGTYINGVKSSDSANDTSSGS